MLARSVSSITHTLTEPATDMQDRKRAMFLTKHSLPVIVDTAPRALVQCKPYKAHLTLEACAKRSKLANLHRTNAYLGAVNPLGLSACRECQVGLNARHVLKALDVPLPTRKTRFGDVPRKEL